MIVNNRASAKQAVEYLLELGHRRIAVLTHSLEGVTSRQERLVGYSEALERNGIPPREDYVKIFSPGKEETGKAVREVLGLEIPPTALVTMNGWITLEVLTALKLLGVKIPEEMSLVGFDDPEWANLVDPPLTVVSQPASELGTVAAQLLFERIYRQRPKGQSTIVELEATFIERYSCKSPWM